MKKSGGIISLIVIIGLLALLGFVSTTGLGKEGLGAVKNMKLGQELSGGVNITYQVIGDKLSKKDMKATIYRLQNRIEKYSAQATVKQEDGLINVQLPDTENANEILRELIEPGALYFIRERDNNGKENYSLSGTETYNLDKTAAELQEDGSIILTAEDIKDAQVVAIDTDSGEVNNTVRLSFTEEGTEKFARATKAASEADETLAIYYDGEIISVPDVTDEVKGGSAQISGGLTFKEADTMAFTIREGGLNLELKELSSELTGTSLNKNAINGGLKAGLAGMAVIFLLLCAIYRLQGVAASLTLTVYTGLVFIFVNAFSIRITILGILAILLSIAAAAGTNICIAARTKEEMFFGSTVLEGLGEGFKKALPAILDLNITLLIAAGALWLKGSDSVRGFAQILVIGVVLSLFSALIIYRQTIYSFYAVGLQQKTGYGKIKISRKPINFLRIKKALFAIPVSIILVGLVIMGMHGSQGKGLLKYGTAIKGGTTTSVLFASDYDEEEIGEVIVPLVKEAIKNNEVKIQKIEGTNQVDFETKNLTLDQRENLYKTLSENLGVSPNDITSVTVSKSVSLGNKHDMVAAAFIFGACMLLYLWFRLKDIRFAASSVLTILFNVLAVLAVYAVLRIPADSTLLVCMLIISAYSANGIITVFQRIREEMKRKKEGEKLTVLVNRCITRTMSGIIFTSFTTLVAVFALYYFEMGSVKIMTLPFISGIVIQAYSSICIGAGLWHTSRVRRTKETSVRN
jgi:SecD/SecF fusion protein